MSKPICHFCERLEGLIVFPDSQTLCPRCWSNMMTGELALPGIIRHKFKFHPVIDDRGTLDFIGAQLMANFMYNGMSVHKIARQMGINHSTVYARLRKYDLIYKDDEDKIRLKPTLNDFAYSGGLDHVSE